MDTPNYGKCSIPRAAPAGLGARSPRGSSKQGQGAAARAPGHAGGVGQVLTYQFPSKLYITLLLVMREDVKTNHQSRYSRTFFFLLVFLSVFCVCVCLKYKEKIPDGGIW